MSIQYTFTPYGTIQIRCGRDWIEVKLPGGGDGGNDAAPDPIASPATPATTPAPAPVASPAPPPRPPAPEPATPPGVMFIESSTAEPFDARDLFVVEIADVVRWNLAEFKDLDPEALHRVVRQRVTRVKPRRFGSLMVLDVDLGTMSPDDAGGLSRLQKLLKEPGVDFDLLRLWQNDRLE